MKFFFAVFKDASGRMHHFEVPPTSSVASLRGEMASRLGQDPKLVQFAYNGAAVPEDATFESLSYQRGQVIEVKVQAASVAPSHSTVIAQAFDLVGDIPRPVMKKSPSVSELQSRQL